MKRNRRYFGYLLIVVLLFLLSACATLESKTKEILQRDYMMTEEEATTGAAHAVRMDKGKKNPDGTLVLEDGGYAIDYEFGVPLVDRHKKIVERLNDIKVLLNERELSQYKRLKGYIDYFASVRERLRQQKLVLEWIEGRYAHILKYLEFLEKLGINTKMLEKIKKYHNDSWITCPLVDLRQEAQFEPDYVISAKKTGQPEVIERRKVEEEFFLEKDNPDYPAVNKTEKTIRVKVRKTLIYSSISVDGDQQADYIEVYRQDENGQPEEFPVLAVYHTITDDRITVVKLDIDEPGHPSFGIPDYFYTYYDIESGRDIEQKHRDLIEKILKGRDTEKEFRLAEHKMNAFFAKPGEIEIAQVEISETGWPKPDAAYRQGGNFEIFVKYAIEEPAAVGHGTDSNKGSKIDWIALRYHAPNSIYIDIAGRVVEFYRPSERFAEMRFDRISVNQKKLEVFPHNNVGISMLVQSLIQERPFRIDYDSGENRISIIDNDYDGKFEARKLQAKPVKVKLENNAEIVSTSKSYHYTSHDER